MDSNTKIVSNEAPIPVTAPATSMIKPNQYVPIAAGVGGGIVIGALLYRFVINPLIAKYKDKKAAANAKPAEVVEEKKD